MSLDTIFKHIIAGTTTVRDARWLLIWLFALVLWSPAFVLVTGWLWHLLH